MSAFQCPVVRVAILPHENADSLEIAQVGGYLSVVRKGQFADGDFAVYIPEQAVIPEWLLETLGFWDDLNGKGKLSGSQGDRVRAMKLRGVLSQGIVLQVTQAQYPEGYLKEAPDCDAFISNYDCEHGSSDWFHEGDDAAAFLDITKYEPAVPAHMAGRALGGDLDATLGYDFENIKKFPSLFSEGEAVVMTEKIHGTFVQVGLIPEAIFAGKTWADKVESLVLDGANFKPVVTSKGQGAKGILLDTADEFNLYVKAATDLGLWTKLHQMRTALGVPADKPIFLCGEIFGPGVQTNFAYGQSAPTFQAFDLYVGTRSDGFFVDYGVMLALCEDGGVATVPLLYCGAFSQEVLDLHTNGSTQIRRLGIEPHIREGLVVKSLREARHPVYGRKIAKSVSEQYLLKGKTTEFQ